MKIRLYIYAELAVGLHIALSKEQIFYCFRVMRAKINDVILVFNEIYGEWACNLFDNYAISIKLIRHSINRTHIQHLIFAKIPNQLLKKVIRQATELDINAISIINTNFCNQNLNINYERLKKITIEASEQCNRLDIPTINHSYRNIKDLLQNFPTNTNLIFCNERLCKNENYNTKTNFQYQNNIILIGPEGGFSDKEQEMLSNFHQTIAISLSRNILQVDTAVVVAINYILNSNH